MCLAGAVQYVVVLVMTVGIARKFHPCRAHTVCTPLARTPHTLVCYLFHSPSLSTATLSCLRSAPLHSRIIAVVRRCGGAVFQLSKMGDSSGPNTELYGVALLVGSLVLDGLCGPTQERVHGEFPCSNLAFMFINNLHAMFIVGVPLVLSSQLVEGVRRHRPLRLRSLP